MLVRDNVYCTSCGETNLIKGELLHVGRYFIVGATCSECGEGKAMEVNSVFLYEILEKSSTHYRVSGRQPLDSYVWNNHGRSLIDQQRSSLREACELLHGTAGLEIDLDDHGLIALFRVVRVIPQGIPSRAVTALLRTVCL
jgi:hypothetical protein